MEKYFVSLVDKYKWTKLDGMKIENVILLMELAFKKIAFNRITKNPQTKKKKYQILNKQHQFVIDAHTHTSFIRKWIDLYLLKRGLKWSPVNLILYFKINGRKPYFVIKTNLFFLSPAMENAQ